jgi:ADP-heptose:LPS heptosyltransferase
MCSDRKPTDSFFSEPVYRQTQILFELAIGQQLTLPTELPLPSRYMELAASMLPDGPLYIGFAPGAGGKEKCWPLERFVEVARVQALRNRVPVFFLGPDERAWRADLANAIPAARFPEYGPDGCVLGGPMLTIALARRLRANVANDSGAGHLLAAGGRPLISLFGHTDERKFTPPFGSRRVIHAREFGGTSMSNIPVNSVVQAIDDVCR